MSIMRCKSTFFAVLKGQERRVRTGELLSSDDPVVKQHAPYFESVEEHLANKAAMAEPVVERATAEPGEKRALGRPRKARPEDDTAARVSMPVAPKPAAEK